MTSSNTPAIKAVKDTDGTTPEPKKRDHGIAVLRGKEAKSLINLACDALSESISVGYDMHDCIYRPDGPEASLLEQLDEALTCLSTADHYLRMLDEVIDPGDETPAAPADPDQGDPPF